MCSYSQAGTRPPAPPALLSLVCDRNQPVIVTERTMMESWRWAGLLPPKGTNVLCCGSWILARVVVCLESPSPVLKSDKYLFLKFGFPALRAAEAQLGQGGGEPWRGLPSLAPRTSGCHAH